MIFAILIILFAVLMSLPFLIANCGVLILIGFVPLLVMDVLNDIHRVKGFFWYYFSAFVLWNACTTFWVCNATVGGGIAAVILNSLQMSLIFSVFRFSKKKFGAILPYVFLAFMWLAWERFYFISDISWPWLTLGNAFAGSVKDIQWYEYTGTLGGSLWAWVCNISLFYLLVFLLGGHFRDMRFYKKAVLVLWCVLVTGTPIFLSRKIYNGYEEASEGKVSVVIAQPNIDPYRKFTAMSQSAQTTLLLDLYRSELGAQNDGKMLLLAPETFTNDIVLNAVEESTTFSRFVDFLKSYPNTDLLFGASTYEYVFSNSAPSLTARELKKGEWLETHNSAIVTDHTSRYEIFHKSRLVVGTELTPYPKVFNKIDDLLGGVMGHCAGQDEISLLHLQDGTPIGCAVCYESVFGDYCTGYIKKGARALVVITNDAWWGNTPGYRQHLTYSSLRAIENRRDIARCANTGISAFINQKGEITQRSHWWTEETLTGEINLSSKQTFFSKHGDITGKVSTILFLVLLAYLIVKCALGRREEH